MSELDFLDNKDYPGGEIETYNTKRERLMLIFGSGGWSPRKERYLMSTKRPVNDDRYDRFVEKYKAMIDGLDYDEYEFEEFVFPVIYRRYQDIFCFDYQNVLSDSIALLGSFSLIGTALVFSVLGDIGLILAAFAAVPITAFAPNIVWRFIASKRKNARPDIHKYTVAFDPNSFLYLRRAFFGAKENHIKTKNRTYLQIKNDVDILEKSKDSSFNQTVGFPNHISLLGRIKKEWKSWELDILKVVQYPALFDMDCGKTREFQQALIYADSIKPSNSELFDSAHPFVLAVVDVELKWKAAVDNAKKVQLSSFLPEEQKRLEKALKLLRIALDESGSPEERQVSYKRAMKELGGLVAVPAATLGEIEGRGLRLELV